MSLLLGAALTTDTLRRVYAVGRGANDHFVAAVVLGCMGFYALQSLLAPALVGEPLWLAGMAGIWGLFFALHRDDAPPAWVRWLLAYPSQLAYAFALWGGLFWLLRLPVAWALGADPLWAGQGLLLPAGLALLGHTNAYLWGGALRVHRVPGLPAPVVQLSDLHASPLMHRAELDALVDRVNALEPALVAITGDLVMPFSEREHGYLVEALARLRSPVVACAGNHDLPVLESLREALGDAGVRLLVDEQVQVGPFAVTGLAFHWTRARERAAEALAGLPRLPGFAILLAHDPRVVSGLPDDRYELALSGHTHGGQVAANMLGLSGSVLRLLGVRDQGWFGRHYVHRGNWFTGLPPRMGVAGELALLLPGAPS